ncbi:hypothetical protein PT300_08300 [Enterobacteriaceae bacterium ESL0689]|nr:hypothetical protein [Enterobacteriaceae bacterium ESL0689]
MGTVNINVVSDGISSTIKGDDPLKGGLLSGAAAGFGYGAGKLVQYPLDLHYNPMKPWKDWLWTDIGMGISKPLPIDSLPGVVGNMFGSGTTELTNDQAGKWTSEHKEIKK